MSAGYRVSAYNKYGPITYNAITPTTYRNPNVAYIYYVNKINMIMTMVSVRFGDAGVSLISERARTGTNGHERGHERSRIDGICTAYKQAFYAHRVAPSDGNLSTRSRNGGTGECGQRSGVATAHKNINTS